MIINSSKFLLFVKKRYVACTISTQQVKSRKCVSREGVVGELIRLESAQGQRALLSFGILKSCDFVFQTRPNFPRFPGTGCSLEEDDMERF